ncbi:sirohydrochlorin chelatase [Saccharomonospora piscinae]|uniref:Sirohydrochlorin chelatase n=1 Tax=Saccharomonospora piscinae TaxID=687388 RepID=A0A1V8ZXJ8_SACPI|nr:sirohydrochlorin chelatase [Saccharomonospora piscinae]OQO89521.1 sirohydrochlorin chelatase [Saccharomonospora piscinae]TLW91214.1 sirohydrochlorin chelatase [Saccharomonospora piscinae]
MTDAAPLVVVAHGSRDPRSAATVRHLVALVRDRAGAAEVRTAFLDLSDPPVPAVLADLHAAGHRHVVLVPLLLGSAYHARVDLPSILADVTGEYPGLGVSQAEVLGPDPALRELALDRLRATGVDLADPGLGVVLSAVGSSHAPANEAVARLAREWEARHGCLVSPAFASAAQPDVAAALTALRTRGARRFAVASWFLAPGLLPDRVREAASVARAPVAEPLGADARVADVVLDRYATAAVSAA